MDKDLELQLSEKKASKVEALCKVQELEKTLQRQKDSRAEQHMLLAQQEEDITKLKTALIQTQEELKSHRLHRQEESKLEATISPQANPPLNSSSSMPTAHPKLVAICSGDNGAAVRRCVRLRDFQLGSQEGDRGPQQRPGTSDRTSS
ncbi:hypothetical protein D9C73_007951 [Collichthys lucidus]|uniref:Uncharacterized protein n=1 Tax=Collichthys lucidus TaxID=240159 RepID=A0A4U5UI94_COLLU|nr:hypothetical protein D9C73_007951 [Collichthys lucidus]